MPSVGSRRTIVARSDISPSRCQALAMKRRLTPSGRRQINFRSRRDRPRLVMSSSMPPAKQKRPAAVEARSGRIAASTLVTALSRRSPIKPPMLWGMGQLVILGSEDAAQASSSTATGASRSLARTPSSRPLPISCSAQNSGGRMISTPARPSSCMIRSETMAPIGPSRLRTGPLAACVRLGSAIFQVSRLTAAAAAAASTT
jgi:hypothetical protein